MTGPAAMRRQGRARRLAEPRVLVFATRGAETLFLEGGPAKWFAGRLNGLGGVVEADEDVAAAAVRETREECGLTPSSVRLAAVVNVDAEPPVILFVFGAELPPGDVRPCSEGRLVWLDEARVADPATPLLPDVRGYLALLRDVPPGAPPRCLSVRW